MRMLNSLCFCVCLFFLSASNAQENLNLMFYNLLNYPLEDAVPNRIDDLGIILSDYQPDLFMVCELNNSSGAQDILESLQTNVSSNFEMATYQNNTSDDTISDQNDLQNLIFYDATKFILVSQHIVTTIFRDFNHYKLRLNSTEQDTNPIEFDVIVCHLKASSGGNNAALRYQMVLDLENYLDTLPSDSRVLLAGDFNFYTSSEDGFQELIDQDNSIPFIDPANKIGSWHNNTNYLDVFTQSTRTQNGLGGAPGGFDDRFDFIMASEDIMSDPEISYIQDSYKVYGNNNNINCFNRAINSTDCSGSDFSFQIRNALHNFSDHLPVTIQLQTNASLSTTEFISYNGIEFIGGNVIQNKLRLKINPLNHDNGQLNIYNTIGQLIKTIKVNSEDVINIDISSIANGVYYIVTELNKKPFKVY